MEAQTPTIRAVTAAALQVAQKSLTTGAPPPSKAMHKALADVCVLLEARAGKDPGVAALVGSVKRVLGGERRI